MELKLENVYDLNGLFKAPNAASMLSDEDLTSIGKWCAENYCIDEGTRHEWLDKYKEATATALQIYKEKVEPWAGASNVKFPGLTTACLHFQSRAQPALVTKPELVKCATVGDDPQGLKMNRAERVGQFMSYQLLVEDQNWEADTDRLLFTLPIVGCLVRKSYFNTAKNKICSELIMPEDFVCSYYTKTLESCPRYTVTMCLSEREIKNKQLQGQYLDVDLDCDYGEDGAPSKLEEIRMDRGFIKPQDDPDAPCVMLEQYCYMDLDGDDYAEPYIVTVALESGTVVRLVPNFTSENIRFDNSDEVEGLKTQIALISMAPMEPNAGQQQQLEETQSRTEQVRALHEQIQDLQSDGRIIDIEPLQYCTKYSFIPSLDGSFYDIGFGQLLVPINSAIDTLLNQLIDAGTLQNCSLGFIASNARIRGQDFRFRPFEYKRLEVPAGNLKDALLPLPVNQPSSVLLQLLELLINYEERISSVSDLMAGETPGQNTPAQTSMAALDQGMKIFNGILARLYRAFSQEYRKIYVLNRLHLSPQKYFKVVGGGDFQAIYQQDFLGDPNEIDPQADPSCGSDAQRLQRAQAVLGMAQSLPGFNNMAVTAWVLKEMKVPNIQMLFPGTPPQPNPELLIKQAREQTRAHAEQHKATQGYMKILAQISKYQSDAARDMAQAKAAGDANAMKMIEHNLTAFQSIHDVLIGMEQNDIQQQQVDNDKNRPAPASAS